MSFIGRHIASVVPSTSSKQQRSNRPIISPPRKLAAAAPPAIAPCFPDAQPFNSSSSSVQSPPDNGSSHPSRYTPIHAPTPHRHVVRAIREFIQNPFGFYTRTSADAIPDSVQIRQSFYVHADPVPGLADNPSNREPHPSYQEREADSIPSIPTELSVTNLPIDDTESSTGEDSAEDARPQGGIRRRPKGWSTDEEAGEEYLLVELRKLRQKRLSSNESIDPPGLPSISSPEPQQSARRGYRSITRRNVFGSCSKFPAPERSVHVIGRGRERAGSAWTTLGLLGQGAQGKVYLTRHEEKRDLVAMKVISLRETSRKSALRSIVEELRILECLEAEDHPFLLGPMAVAGKWAWTSSKGFLHVTMPVCAGGNLLDRGHEVRRLRNDYQVALIAAELVLGIEALHNMGIVHHDIKPENIVIDADGHCRIADFGGAKLLPQTGYFSSRRDGRPIMSLDYAAPELVRCFFGHDVTYTESVDWWALGATLLVLLVDEYILHELCDVTKVKFKETYDYAMDIWDRLQAFGYSQACIEFILDLLQFEPKNRPTLGDIKSDTFFSMLFTSHGNGEQCSWSCISHKGHPTDAPFAATRSCRVRVGSGAVRKNTNDRQRQRLGRATHRNGLGVLKRFREVLAERNLELEMDNSCDPSRMQQQVLEATKSLILLPL